MGDVYQTRTGGMKDRTGECWFLPAAQSEDAVQLTDQFLVIVASIDKGKYFVHTFVSTDANGKFCFKSMREWTMIPMEDSAYRKVG